MCIFSFTNTYLGQRLAESSPSKSNLPANKPKADSCRAVKAALNALSSFCGVARSGSCITAPLPKGPSQNKPRHLPTWLPSARRQACPAGWNSRKIPGWQRPAPPPPTLECADLWISFLFAPIHRHTKGKKRFVSGLPGLKCFCKYSC